MYIEISNSNYPNIAVSSVISTYIEFIHVHTHIYIHIHIHEHDQKGRNVPLQLFKIVQLQFQCEAASVVSRTGGGDFYHLYWWNQGLPRCYQPSKDDPGSVTLQERLTVTQRFLVDPDKSSSLSMFQHSSTEIFTTDLAQQVSGLGTQQMGWWMQNRWVDTLLHGWTPGPIRFQHTNVVGVNSAHMFSIFFGGVVPMPYFTCIYLYNMRFDCEHDHQQGMLQFEGREWRSAMYTLAFCCM